MNKKNTLVVAGLALLLGGVFTASNAQAQVIVGPPMIGPRVVARAVVPPIPVPVAPVVRATYRPAYVTATPSVSVYRSYSPRYAPVPVYRASPVVVTTRVRPALVPFQPVRNAMRLSLFP